MGLMYLLTTYGVETARGCFFIRCVKSFSRYGVGRSFRHLLLLSDFISRQGVLSSFCIKEKASSASHLQRMSFERASYTTNAVSFSSEERFTSPASRISYGGIIGLNLGL